MREDEPRNDGEMLELLRETALDTVVQQLRILHSLKQRRGASDPPPACAPPASASRAAVAGAATSAAATGPGASEFLFDLARLSLASYRGWLKVTSSHFDFLTDSLSKLSGGPAVAPAQRPALQLAAQARRDERAVVGFVLENPESRDIDVVFTQLALRTADGVAPLRNPAIVRLAVDGRTPLPEGRVVLAPLESARLGVVVDLAGSAAGAYRGESLVILGDRIVATLRVALDVVPS